MRLSQKFRRRATLAVIPAALIASGAVVSTASYAAFSSTTSNATNNWSAGTVELSDDDSGSALFTASGLQPGSTDTKCIVVTSTGSLPSTVKLYGTDPVSSNGLSDSLRLTVTQGTGGTAKDCSGFTPLAGDASVFSGTLTSFGSTAKAFSTGRGLWAPTGEASESRTFRFTYTLDSATPNTAQNGSASIGFTWEAQSG